MCDPENERTPISGSGRKPCSGAAITLCGVVKNESRNIPKYIGRTFPLFDGVEITDTGSDDGTIALLRSEYGIEPSVCKVSPKSHFSILDARNVNIRSACTEYIFILDADEIITGATLNKAREAIGRHPDADGFFFEWNTYKSDGTVIRDYKLNLFKNDPRIRFLGERHPNVNVSIRDKGGHALWVGGEIAHHPDCSLESDKLERYLSHLHELAEKEPGYVRYHWFLGMTLCTAGKKKKAFPFLSACASSKSLRFPVECLNSHLLLAECLYSIKKRTEALETVDRALAFHEGVKTDFEVKVNFHLRPTLAGMREDILAGCPRLRIYPFGGV